VVFRIIFLRLRRFGVVKLIPGISTFGKSGIGISSNDLRVASLNLPMYSKSPSTMLPNSVLLLNL